MFADVVTGPKLFALGVAVLTAVLVRLAARYSRRSRSREPVVEFHPDRHAAEKASAQRINTLEVRLLDFDREVNGRVETTLTTLDELISEADAEINRLEVLLTQTAETLPPERSSRKRRLQPRDRQMLRHLLAAGYSATEVAHLAGVDVAEVTRLLPGDTGRTGFAA